MSDNWSSGHTWLSGSVNGRVDFGSGGWSRGCHLALPPSIQLLSHRRARTRIHDWAWPSRQKTSRLDYGNEDKYSWFDWLPRPGSIGFFLWVVVCELSFVWVVWAVAVDKPGLVTSSILFCWFDHGSFFKGIIKVCVCYHAWPFKGPIQGRWFVFQASQFFYLQKKLTERHCVSG